MLQQLGAAEGLIAGCEDLMDPIKDEEQREPLRSS